MGESERTSACSYTRWVMLSHRWTVSSAEADVCCQQKIIFDGIWAVSHQQELLFVTGFLKGPEQLYQYSTPKVWRQKLVTTFWRLFCSFTKLYISRCLNLLRILQSLQFQKHCHIDFCMKMLFSVNNMFHFFLQPDISSLMKRCLPHRANPREVVRFWKTNSLSNYFCIFSNCFLLYSERWLKIKGVKQR